MTGDDECMSDADFYMSLACVSAKRSKDPNTKVGACIVNETNEIVGLGYNGMPNGVSDHELPWNRQGDRLDTKYPYVCHAELNAIINAKHSDIEGAVLYATLFPCNECAKLIIQTGIKEVVFLLDKYPTVPDFIAAKRLFDLAKVPYSQYKPQLKSLTFTFQPDSLLKMNDDAANDALNKSEPDYISWSEYFMAVACLSAARNRMRNYYIGVCIVNDRNRIVGIGKNNPEFACSEVPRQNQPQMCVCNAVKSISTKNCSDFADCTIYLTMFPCNECAKYIISCAIKKIIYLHNGQPMDSEMIEAQKLLNFAGVECKRFEIPQKLISIRLCTVQL